MAKNCFIYETLNQVKDLQSVSKDKDGLMTLSGCFGVCGVRNNNQRVYETSNYSKMVTEMKERISKNGGIPGELEHPQTMNITLENISHKITDINIDENGVVTGTIKLLNTPKGKLAQAIVEGGLPLFISSRATGAVDRNNGNVTLEKISTYDLVGSPGFSQAELHLNENQVAESLNESVYYISENENNENIDENMELQELLEKFEALESRVDELESLNEELQDKLDEQSNMNIKKIAEGVQKWIIEEYSPVVQEWVTEHFAEELKDEVVESATEAAKDNFINEMAPKIQNWIVEEFAPEVQNWIVEQYSPEVQNWIVEQYSPEVQNWVIEEVAAGIQDWIVEEYSPEVENWLNESYSEKVDNQISESIQESKKNSLSSIDETLKVLESIEETKPTYSRKAMITENLDEPKFIQEMPADARVKWDMASNEVKESIMRRAKIYNFVNEGAIARFWNTINFNEIKPTPNVYEGLEKISDERERSIRAAFRRHRMF